MAQICPTSIHVCRARVTRLNADGSVAAAPNNHVVTTSIVSLEVQPEVLAGEAKQLVGGCDCICVSYKGKDKLMRFNLTLQMCDVEPALVDILTGSGTLVNGSSELIGNSFPDQIDCSTSGQPATALEVWSDAWTEDRQVASPNQYIRWIFKMAFWQFDNWKLENDFMVPSFKGFTRQNPNFANAYVDYPAGVTTVGNLGGYFWDSAAPAAYCGYSSTST